jgi:two-component system KDP operon response regulator KdpE
MITDGLLVLLVEDEAPLRKFLRASLVSHGYRLLEAQTANEAMQLLTTHSPDLVVLDLGLPDRDGLELTREVRGFTDTPIIVVSARGKEEDKVLALDAGADDYLTKPFGVQELLARIRVAIRHAQRAQGATASETFDAGPIHIDLARREVTVGGREIHLTPTEYKMLALLAKNAGKVLTHRQILKDVWGPAYVQHLHYVRVHMAELRKKVEADPARPQWIVTEPGVGYRLRDREPK